MCAVCVVLLCPCVKAGFLFTVLDQGFVDVGVE
jgi:hypothetical protein